MNETNFEMEFKFPGELEKMVDEIGDKVTVLLMKTVDILYPDGDIPEDFLQEVLTILLPKVVEGMEKAVDRFLEDQG